MQTQIIQIDGTFSFADNVRTLKLGDKIVLKPNPNNSINSNAVGAYTLNDKKIGYIPFTSKQVDIKSKYYVFRLNLSQNNPVLQIAREFEVSNIIEIQSECDKYASANKNVITDELKLFKKNLEKAGHIIEEFKVLYKDDNYLNLLINGTIFYTVTRKYYDENIFRYDELYNYGLIPKCIYIPFQTHRIEIYIQRHYKHLFQFLENREKKKPFQKELTLKEKELIKNFRNVLFKNDEYKKEIIQDKNLIITDKDNLDKYKLYSKLPIEYFKDMKIGGLCYNHEYNGYCNVDFYNDDSIIEITIEDIDMKKYSLTEKVGILVMSKKSTLYIYNPIIGFIIKIIL